MKNGMSEQLSTEVSNVCTKILNKNSGTSHHITSTSTSNKIIGNDFIGNMDSENEIPSSQRSQNEEKSSNERRRGKRKSLSLRSGKRKSTVVRSFDGGGSSASCTVNNLAGK